MLSDCEAVNSPELLKDDGPEVETKLIGPTSAPYSNS